MNNNQNFADIIYNQINNSLGGTSPKQYLTLMLPGIILDEKDYAYDYDHGQSKSVVVEANESRLANKMFDPCKITGSDNGFSLPYQYKTALDSLSPKINKDLGDYKNRLRQLLICDYPYDFGDGSNVIYSLQEVYFRLYDEYIEEMHRWTNIIQEKKEELKKKYEINSDYEQAYLEWYENNADLYLNEINEKRSKVLSIFSPNDMKILEGVLDSGCGAELQEARQTLNNVRKLTPEGGYVYPVRFVPPDWFKNIGSTFTSADLMESPETLSEKLQILSSRRMELFSFVFNVADLINDNQIKNAVQKAKNIKEKIDSSRSAIIRNYGSTVSKILYSAVSLKKIFVDDQKMFNTLIKTLPQKSYRDSVIADKIVKSVKKRLNTEINLQDEYVDALKVLVGVVRVFEKNANFEKILLPVIEQLDIIEEKIEDLQNQFTISSKFFTTNKSSTQLNSSDSTALVPKGFTQISIKSDFNELCKESGLLGSEQKNTQGCNFLFLGKQQSSESSFTSTFNDMLKKNCEISIDMNVAKVGIERDWFNPGVFALTKDMLKLGNVQISPKGDYDSMTDERMNEMQNCIFPAYPVAMLLARDIKISFKFEKNTDISSYYKEFESHAKYGGNFFIFRGNASNSSFSTSRVFSSITDDQTITLKFDTTQLIGYYMEATYADKSVPFELLNKQERETMEFSSISEFVSTYKKILDSCSRMSRMLQSNQEKQNTQLQQTEKEEFDVVLDKCGENKLKVIQEIRSITGLSLKESKNLVETTGAIVVSTKTMAEAEEIKKKLENLGAVVSIK